VENWKRKGVFAPAELAEVEVLLVEVDVQALALTLTMLRYIYSFF